MILVHFFFLHFAVCVNFLQGVRELFKWDVYRPMVRHELTDLLAIMVIPIFPSAPNSFEEIYKSFRKLITCIFQ